jgi:hypothetical protein
MTVAIEVSGSFFLARPLPFAEIFRLQRHGDAKFNLQVKFTV